MTTSAATTTETPSVSQTKTGIRFWRRLCRNRLVTVGLVIIALQLFTAVFAPWLTTYDPTAQDLAVKELPPGSEGHWLGTDEYGRDMWSRLVYGSRISLLVGISSVVLGLVGGVVLGLLAGYYRWLDGPIMRLVDLMFAFPGILLAMLVIAMLGTRLINVVIAISIWSVPTCARIVRGSVLSLKDREYVQALRSMGAGDGRILFKHLLPNCAAPIIVFATMRMATAILSTSALSFLGLGAQPPTPEWGAMIAAGRDYMWTAPHLTIIPGVAIMLVVFAFNVVGDGLRDALDPHMDVTYES
ncbi:MAG: ABC transporter permease [Firmicutes bacterium]|uniref:Peptide/nickel transport system permease protein n=1 Tax=Melghirimyces thermohalophilus TaxID=1236220 RepID=A0A1G6ITZ7_9BACL|nr:ABC transporter permease [Melghirimyces thermohalophilus]MDA8352873.1 ABC transporter permease [Bacillota bacterium]SDC09903.1 peptide/nickel transport system permease protein [Melghirimyces thermohalophilus]